MIRVYFVFEDPLDETGVNLSFIDVETENSRKAFERVERAAETGELWENMYPQERHHPYRLINTKMMYLDISALVQEQRSDTVLSL